MRVVLVFCVWCVVFCAVLNDARLCFVCVVVLVCARFNVCVSFASYCESLHGLSVLCVAVCWRVL